MVSHRPPLYYRGYEMEVGRRAPGFLIRTLTTTTLLVGALGRTVNEALGQV